MKNFIFKSKFNVTNSDLYKIQMKLNLIQVEQRHARSDLAHIIKQLNQFLPEFIETSPQTEQKTLESEADEI